MDTTFAYSSVTWEPEEFENIVGMPILLELYVNRIEDLRPINSDQYQGTLYRGDSVYKKGDTQDWHLYESITSFTLAQKHSDFIKRYYPDFFARPNPSMSAHYWRFREFLRKQNPDQLIGSYITGSNCRDQISPDFFPREIIDCHKINSAGHAGLDPAEPIYKEIHAGPWSVHPTDTQNINVYQDLIVDEAIQRNVDFLFLDNMGGISFRDFNESKDVVFANGFIAHIDALSKQLNAAGCGAIYNLGGLPYWPRRATDPQTRETLEKLFDSAIGKNGIYVEQTFRYRDNADLMQWEIEKFRVFLEKGTFICIGGPYPASYGNKTAAAWMAAMALVIRKPGDPLFISTDRTFDSKLKPWKDWPSLYGALVGQNTFVKNNNNNWHAVGNFEHGQITVVHIYVPWQEGQTGVTKALPVATSGYTIIPGHEPQRGTWDQATEQYSLNNDPKLDKNRDDGYSDWFILGANPAPMQTFHQQMIAVDVIIQSENWR